MNRTCFHIVYIGKPPNILACEFIFKQHRKCNADFYLHTDCFTEWSAIIQAENIFVRNIDKNLVNTFLQSTFDVHPVFDPRAVGCGAKTLTPILFKEIVDVYEYWGYMDYDSMLNGDIINEVLATMDEDVILFDINKVVGIVALFKNDPVFVNILYDETYGVKQWFRELNKIEKVEGFLTLLCYDEPYKSNLNTYSHKVGKLIEGGKLTARQLYLQRVWDKPSPRKKYAFCFDRQFKYITESHMSDESIVQYLQNALKVAKGEES